MTHFQKDSKYVRVLLVGGPYDGNVAIVHRDAAQTKFPHHDYKYINPCKRVKLVNSYWLYLKRDDGKFHFEAEEVGE